MALGIAAAAARASGLGTARSGGVTTRTASRALFLFLLDDRLRSFGLSRSFGQALGFFLGCSASFLGGGLFGLAVLFGSAALFLARVLEGALFTAARFFERCKARFLGFAKKLLLKLLAARNLVLGGRALRLRGRGCGLRRSRRQLRSLGGGLGRFG